MSRAKNLLIVIVLINVIWNILLFLNPDKQTPFNYLFNVSYGIIYLFGAAAALWGMKKNKFSSWLGKSLVFYATALTSYTLALFIWALYNLVLNVEVPYPSIADILWLLFVPMSSLGFVFLIFSLGGKFTFRLVVELVVLSGIMFAILYSFLNQESGLESLPTLERILDITYPLLDSFLVALAITGIRTTKGSLHPNLLLFVFASLFMVIADTAFSYRSLQDTYWNGDVVDTLYLIAGGLFATAIISVLSMKQISEGDNKLHPVGTSSLV
ncbi:MAG: Diguanylate cyclase (GGDEF) domain-containing protein [Candidatus Woesebacteria bacterium GW2011_GWB1_39_12]|uniref:Diguanylate cyclase (GGDEF) domain-containing protein n=2 Tax=Candidatus Woeseibacteriota TaxID=1752722 RepID=A0A0G0PJP1_9BACT|nr:MAG: Diguanylate cyclase (GGDEF) domain-containing protein [Candidatus Woesebacteria bacterium GW2011_GWA1_39_12]KKR01097.1 MAG: Diguanylate cyclase (GGDEF) domain-containing protein [Candidatus Woesebacteria bacterium GW2011_GWB1_39_12]